MTLVAHGSNDSSSSTGVAESPISVFCRFALDSSSSLGELRLRGLVAAAGEEGADMARSSSEARVSTRDDALALEFEDVFICGRLAEKTGDGRWMPGTVVEADDTVDTGE